MENEFSPDRYTVGPPLIRDGLKDMQKIFELEAEKSALISAGEALLDWARRELMWQPIETAPRDGWIEAWCSEAEAGLPVFMYPRYVIGSTITHWRPASPPLPPGKLPEPMEAFAEALKRVRGE